MKIVDNRIQFDEDDIFDLDTVLADIIHTALVKFKESHRPGIPNDFFKEPKNITKEDEVQAEYLWEQALDEMIFAFSGIDLLEEYDNIVESPYDYSQDWFANDERTFQPVIKPGYTMQQVEEWQKGRDKWEKDTQERINYGRQLFVKFFDNLWV